MDKSKLIADAVAAANAVAPLVPIGVQGIVAGKAVLDLLATVKETTGATPEKVAEYEAAREGLERAVNAHADRTAASLG